MATVKTTGQECPQSDGRSLHGPPQVAGARARPLDLDVREGEFLCIVGPSGCGKSTFLRLVAGLINPTAGSIDIIHSNPDRHLVAIWTGGAVQLSQVVCLYFILLSLHIPWDQHEWIFIFLASAVVSVLPISLGGGLGTREVVFAEGARYFHLDPQLGVTISLLFYLQTVIGSLWGLYYSFHDPLKGKE